MTRFLFLLLVAAITFAVILFASRPDIGKEFWLWIVGLAGIIVKSIGLIVKKVRDIFTSALPGETDSEIAYYENRAKHADESVG